MVRPISYVAHQPMEPQFLNHYRDGDEIAFRELFNRYEKTLYTLLWRYLGRHDLVEDTLQETFLQLYLSRSQYDNDRPLDAWLFKIAVNKAKDALRRARLRPMISISHLAQSDESSLDDVLNFLASDANSPWELLEKAEKKDRIRQVLADLPPKHHDILTLVYFKQLKYRQIADNLDIPIGTVKSRLHKAVAVFRQEWNIFCERFSARQLME